MPFECNIVLTSAFTLVFDLALDLDLDPAPVNYKGEAARRVKPKLPFTIFRMTLRLLATSISEF